MYVIEVVPVVNASSRPEEALIVATVVLELDQVPPLTGDE